MTKEENIATLNEHLDHWKRLLSEKICDQDEGEKTIDALQNAINVLEQEPCDDAISRESAINAAIEGADIWDGGCNFERDRCITKEINKLSPVSPMPSEDCIRRSDIGLTDFEIVMCNGDYKEGLKMLLEKIEKAPSVTPQPKVGRWIEHFDESGKWYECVQCHTDWGGSVNYCPNCGAKMQEVEDEDSN